MIVNTQKVRPHLHVKILSSDYLFNMVFPHRQSLEKSEGAGSTATLSPLIRKSGSANRRPCVAPADTVCTEFKGQKHRRFDLRPRTQESVVRQNRWLADVTEV